MPDEIECKTASRDMQVVKEPLNNYARARRVYAAGSLTGSRESIARHNLTAVPLQNCRFETTAMKPISCLASGAVEEFLLHRLPARSVRALFRTSIL